MKLVEIRTIWSRQLFNKKKIFGKVSNRAIHIYIRTTHANTARFYNESGRQSVNNPNCHRRRSSILSMDRRQMLTPRTEEYCRSVLVYTFSLVLIQLQLRKCLFPCCLSVCLGFVPRHGSGLTIISIHHPFWTYKRWDQFSVPHIL
jgi:hypothetical protein